MHAVHVDFSSPAVWSALAAWFSAMSAFLVWLIQRHNFHEATRPQLVITGWSRETLGEGARVHDVLTVKGVRNVGRGHATNLVLTSAPALMASLPLAVMGTKVIPILAPGETAETNSVVHVWWENVPSDARSQPLHVTVTIGCTDSHSVRHFTKYELLVAPPFPLPFTSFVMDEVAPGVMCAQRATASTAGWWLRARWHLRRFWAKLSSPVALPRRRKTPLPPGR